MTANFRWSLTDQLTNETYTFEVNPNQMTSPHAPHNTTSFGKSPVSGASRAWRAPPQPWQWKVSGVVLSQAQYDAFVDWMVNRTSKMTLTDHLERTMTVRFVNFAPSQKAPARRLHPWRHTYELDLLVYAGPSAAP